MCIPLNKSVIHQNFKKHMKELLSATEHNAHSFCVISPDSLTIQFQITNGIANECRLQSMRKYQVKHNNSKVTSAHCTQFLSVPFKQQTLILLLLFLHSLQWQTLQLCMRRSFDVRNRSDIVEAINLSNNILSKSPLRS